MPATSLVPEEKRSSLKSFLLERIKNKFRINDHFISGAAYAVDRKFFLKHPLPETNNIGDDLYINQHFRDRIILVRSARVYFLLPSVRDRVLQKVRYVVQEKTQGVKNLHNLKEDYSNSKKVKRGRIINQAINKTASFLARLPKFRSWVRTPSTKLGRPKR